MRVLIFLITCHIFLFSFSSFKETRYIDVIGIEQSKYGKVILSDEVLKLVYTEPVEEIISYYSDKLIITKNNNNKEYSFQNHPELEYMGLILRSIISDDLTFLDELFDITVNNNGIYLKPQITVSNTLEYINIVKVKSITRKIILNMTNKDRIIIETTN